MRKTSQSLIKETRKYMVKTAPEGTSFKSEFEVKYDKDYGIDRILYGDMKITTKKTEVVDGKKKIVEDIIFIGKKVSTTNPKYEIWKAIKRFGKELKDKHPGYIYIYNCKDSGAANIKDEFR